MVGEEYFTFLGDGNIKLKCYSIKKSIPIRKINILLMGVFERSEIGV